ncbi:MAG: polymer-forming cytoskeletal protein [Candidatus Manganitrophus sp.]|nr:polymer-forming cytoskeletal protein [Candidatus Manganitrophus sp.]
MRGRVQKKIIGRGANRLLPLLAVVILLQPVSAMAEQESGNRTVTLRADQAVNGDYFAFGDQVEILGTVHGDVYAAGGEVRVAGTVDGDLLAAGRKIDVEGKVGQDARIAGGEITLSGDIGKNFTAAGGRITLADPATVRGNVISAGDLVISGRIHGDVRTMAGDLQITSAAKVNGDVSYRSPQAARIDEGAKIGGMVMQRRPHRMFDFSPGPWSGRWPG